MSSTAIEEFGSKSITKTGETNASAMVAQATASIQARYVMAMQRPRVWDDVRVKLLQECRRPGFAEVARYRKPIGKGIVGPSIRFAEAALRYAGNLGVDTTVDYEDPTRRVMTVTATDFETNASYSSPVSIDKTVERSEPKDRSILATRTNSAGNTVYIVSATEDELLNKQNAMVSKAARTLILRMIPGDIVEEAQAQCVLTLQDRASKDPAGERKKLCDAFAGIGVQPSQLAQYVGHSLDVLNPGELTDLREIFQTIRDGETTWAAVSDTGETTEKPKNKTESLKDKIKAKAAATVDPSGFEIHPDTGEVIPS